VATNPRRTVQGAGEKTEPTSTRSGLRFGRTSCSTSKLLCVFLTAAIGLGCSAFALSSYGSGGVSDLIESVFVPDAASIPVLDITVDPDAPLNYAVDWGVGTNPGDGSLDASVDGCVYHTCTCPQHGTPHVEARAGQRRGGE